MYIGNIPQKATRSDLVAFWNEYNIKVIPIGIASKIPLMQWRNNWDYKNTIKFVEDNPFCNLAFILGDVIDIESDFTDSNIYLKRLFSDTPTLSYTSGRSRHYIFKNPGFNFNKKEINKIEIRCHYHISVIPPSLHISGYQYQWDSYSDCKIERLNKKHIDKLLFNKPIKKKTSKRSLCNGCNNYVFINKKRLSKELKAFSCLGLKWKCNNCREVDIRTYIKKYI